MIESVTGPMGYEEDAPRLSEIGRMIQGMDRKIDDFRGEVRNQLNDKVSKEVHDAQRTGLLERITALEARARSQTNTIYGGLASIVVGVILFYVQTK